MTNWKQAYKVVNNELIRLKATHVLEVDPANVFGGGSFTLAELFAEHQRLGCTLKRDTFRRQALPFLNPVDQLASTKGRPAALFVKKP